MSKHLPATVWLTRIDGTKKYQAVRTVDGKTVSIAFFPGSGRSGFSLVFSRADARLLAKRINECLLATK